MASKLASLLPPSGPRPTKMFAGKTYWIIGASEGLGRSPAKVLSAEGARLILSARTGDRLLELADEIGNAVVIPMDVTDAQSVAQAAKNAGVVDGLIYSVGQYDPVTAKEWKSESVDLMCEANFTGAVRLLGHVVPAFVARNTGHLVLIGSLAGHRGLPAAIGYGASKAALMHLAENLYADLRNTSIRVQLINPGFIATRLTAKNQFRMPMILTPGEAAKRTLAAMKSRRFETNFPAPFSWVFTIGRLLPKRLFWFLFR